MFGFWRSKKTRSENHRAFLENHKKTAVSNNSLKKELEQKSANNKISLNNFNKDIDQENENLNQFKAKFQDLNEDLSSSKNNLNLFQDDPKTIP